MVLDDCDSCPSALDSPLLNELFYCFQVFRLDNRLDDHVLAAHALLPDQKWCFLFVRVCPGFKQFAKCCRTLTQCFSCGDHALIERFLTKSGPRTFRVDHVRKEDEQTNPIDFPTSGLATFVWIDDLTPFTQLFSREMAHIDRLPHWI